MTIIKLKSAICAYSSSSSLIYFLGLAVFIHIAIRILHYGRFRLLPGAGIMTYKTGI